MALQLSFTDSTGHSADASAYHIVREITKYDKHSKVCEFSVEVYKDSASKNASKSFLERKNYSVKGTTFDTWFATTVIDDAGKSVIERAYEYLKTLSVYSGASDV